MRDFGVLRSRRCVWEVGMDFEEAGASGLDKLEWIA